MDANDLRGAFVALASIGYIIEVIEIDTGFMTSSICWSAHLLALIEEDFSCAAFLLNAAKKEIS